MPPSETMRFSVVACGESVNSSRESPRGTTPNTPADSSSSPAESRGWQRGDREYQDVRDLGGIELIKPLVQEFGAPRVFAYVAQTPFIVHENDLFKSATLYQQRARQMLGW